MSGCHSSTRTGVTTSRAPVGTISVSSSEDRGTQDGDYVPSASEENTESISSTISVVPEALTPSDISVVTSSS